MGYESYVGISRNQLLVKMQQLLPEKRFKHCLGVEQAAINLAERFGVDVGKAGLAGLLHDYAKKLSDEEFLALIDKYALDPALKDWGNNVWHGLVAVARKMLVAVWHVLHDNTDYIDFKTDRKPSLVKG